MNTLKLPEKKKEVPPSEGLVALAEYFTGGMVGHYSVCVNLSGPMKAAADAFFKTRKALGIDGYESKDEAIIALKKAMK